MILASSYGHLNVVQYLIAKKANMNQADTNGKTALDLGTLKIYLILLNAHTHNQCSALRFHQHLLLLKKILIIFY